MPLGNELMSTRPMDAGKKHETAVPGFFKPAGFDSAGAAAAPETTTNGNDTSITPGLIEAWSKRPVARLRNKLPMQLTDPAQLTELLNTPTVQKNVLTDVNKPEMRRLAESNSLYCAAIMASTIMDADKQFAKEINAINTYSESCRTAEAPGMNHSN